MKILFACGGTAGHINPAIAVASCIKKRFPQAQICFVGNQNGMEARLVPEAGFDFVPCRAMGIQRRLTPGNIIKNIKSVGLLITAAPRAARVIRSFMPDVVVGTGGYVSAPILHQANKMGIKTCTHESNAFPGVTTKLLAKTADKVLIAVEDVKKRLPDGREYIVTGNPVRSEVLTTSRQQARSQMNISKDTFVILSFGGSLGAQMVNNAVADVMAWHCKSKTPVPVRHIHATGAYGVELLPKLLSERGVSINNPNLDIREYIKDMPICLAAADVVIGRAGAMTLTELECAGRASILIPSPNVAENHQYFNAMVLANKGAAMVIEEKDLTGELLTKKVQQYMNDPELLNKTEKKARAMAITDATDRIADEVLSLID